MEIVAGEKSYLVRDRDAEFNGRWTGFWAPPFKILDGFTVGVRKDGKVYWLDELKQNSYSYDHIVSSREFSKDGKSLEEEVSMAPHVPALFLSYSGSDFESVLLAVKPVLRFENFEDDLEPAFSFRRSDKQVILEGGGYVEANISADKSIKNVFSGNDFSGIDSNSVVVEFDLPVSVSIGRGEDRYQIPQDIGRVKRSIYEDFIDKTVNASFENDLFERSFHSLKKDFRLLFHTSEAGEGIFAGLPYFPHFFGRDTFWSIRGLNSIGAWWKSRESFRFLINKADSNGRIPHEIRYDETFYPTADANPLFLIALEDYVRWSGDKDFLREIWSFTVDAFMYCMNRADPVFIPHGQEGLLDGTSWMDSQSRALYSVDVQALWIRALKSISYLGQLVDDEDIVDESQNMRKSVSEKFREEFWNEETGFMFDRIKENGEKDSVKTTNPVIASMFELLDQERADSVLDILSSDIFMTDHGIRTMASDEERADGSYQRGTVWPLNTSWFISAALRNDKPEEGLNCLSDMLEKIESLPPATVPELFKKDGSTDGCSLQAWSCGMLLDNMVRGTHGIRVDAPRDKIRIDSKIKGKLNGLKVGGSVLDIEFEKNRVTVSNKGDKSIKVETDEESAVLEPGKESSLNL